VPDTLAHYRREHPEWAEALLAEAVRVCRDGLPVYRSVGPPLEAGFDWSALPPGPGGDRLYRLRPHRFGFLPRLAIAGHLGAATTPVLSGVLESWMRHATAGRDPAPYFSNLVVIYRLLAVTLAGPFVASLADAGDRAAGALLGQLAQIAGADVTFLVPRLGRSVPNNHLLADRFAGWLIARCYAHLWAGADPQALEAQWLAELERQFFDDGGSFEHSLHYHELGLEMALAYLLLARRAGASPPEAAGRRIAHMLRLQVALGDRAGAAFDLGDATDDPLLPLDAGHGRGGGAWREIYRILVDGPVLLSVHDATGAERAFWLGAALGSERLPGAEALRARAARVASLEAFPESGLFVFSDPERDHQLLFRGGPAPGRRLAPGHAHSDLLSVYWRLAGRSILASPGTYSYVFGPASGLPGAPNLRRYLTSAGARSGPCRDDLEPFGALTGSFRDSDPGVRVETRHRDLPGSLAWAEGRIVGPSPFAGWRRAVVAIAGHYVVIADHVPESLSDGRTRIAWQFAPSLQPRIDGDSLTADADGARAVIVAARPSRLGEAVAGRAEPCCGWVSGGYGHLEPAPQVSALLAPGQAEAAFVLQADAAEGAAGLRLLPVPDETGLACRITRPGEDQLLLLGPVRSPDLDGLGSLAFDGTLAWLRLLGGELEEVRVLGCRLLSLDGAGLLVKAAGQPLDTSLRRAGGARLG